jgi:ankyrin repeat protein
MDIHPASSKSWGSEASAHLFELAISSNSGIAEMVIENKTVLLDLLTVQELQSPDDDSGLSTLFLAIYYDRPDIIRYLHKRGVDLSGYCDPYFNGTALYYAVSFGRFGIVELLQKLGCSLEISCDSFGQTPLKTAEMLENFEMVFMINKLIKKNGIAEDLLTRNCQRYLCWIRLENLFFFHLSY